MIFSVLLSLYPKEHPSYLQQSLNSLFSQTLLPDEIILVKDGLLTAELDAIVSDYAARYPILKVIPLPQNQGLGKALNEGLKYCSYDLVARMDTDDIAKPDRFEKQMKVFEEYPELDLVGAWIDEFEGTPQHVLSIRRVPETSEQILAYCKKRNPVNHPVVMFRKSAVLAAGGYLHFPLFEDYYLWVRMAQNKCVMANTGTVLAHVRVGKDMYSRRGGKKYFASEVRLQKYMLNNKIIRFDTYIINILKRFIVQMVLPDRLRGWVFRKFARKPVK